MMTNMNMFSKVEWKPCSKKAIKFVPYMATQLAITMYIGT